MATIVETLVGDKRVQLGNESFARTMLWGANWNKIRIALRCTFTDSGATITNGGITIGLSRGATAGYDSGSVDFVGAQLGSGGYDTNGYSYTTNSGFTCYLFGNSKAVVKLNSAVSVTGNHGSSNGFVPVTTSGQVGAIFIDAQRLNNATITFNSYVKNSAATCTDDIFNQSGEYESANSVPNFGWLADRNAVYAGDGCYDSVMIRWNKADPFFEISEIRILRFW